uniref:Putative secreted protein n=1 Tax=Rhipicephalus microplus TaxID=6941 RepID=A0A6G5A0U3_RHIMP
MCVGCILLCIVSLFPFTGVEICHASCKWKRECLKYCKSTHCSLGVDCESKWFLITNFLGFLTNIEIHLFESLLCTKHMWFDECAASNFHLILTPAKPQLRSKDNESRA